MVKKILIVEDNPRNLELVEYLLEEAGYDILSATDGDIAMEIVQKTTPDLVLLDIHLPGCDGLVLVRKFRQIGTMKTTPIIALTAHALEGDRERFLSGGCDGYIPKPINVATFIDEVSSFLKPQGE